MMVTKPHAVEIRLSRLVERCRQHRVATSSAGRESVVKRGFSSEAYLLIEEADAKALEWVASILPEYEAMKVAEEHARERRAAERKKGAR